MEPGQVAGRELVENGPGGQVGRHGRVAEHDVRSSVDELPDLVGHPVHRTQLEVAAGDRASDRLRVAGGDVSRQVGHPGGRLGLPVHHVEVDPPAPAPVDPLGHPLRRHPPAGLGHEAQRRNVENFRADPFEQVERVRHAGDVGHAVALQRLGEAAVDDRRGRRHDRTADEQVGVEHRQPVAVVQRERRDSPVSSVEAEVAGDRFGVAHQVVVRQPDQLRRTRGTRGAEE